MESNCDTGLKTSPLTQFGRNFVTTTAAAAQAAPPQQPQPQPTNETVQPSDLITNWSLGDAYSRRKNVFSASRSVVLPNFMRMVLG